MNERAIALTSDVDKKLYNGDQVWMISPEMFKKINEKIDGKHGNCKVLLLYLIFQKQNGGFNPSEKTICDYCNFTHSRYSEARAQLYQMGFITYVQYKEICINYQKIME